MSDLKQCALALYKPPFRRVHGYIYDADSRVVADDAAATDEDAALRIRGWGRIQYLTDPEALQDAAGDLIAEALTEYWQCRTQPEATAPAQDLSAAIPTWHDRIDGKADIDHERDATPEEVAMMSEIEDLRAALASSANALSAGDRVDAEQINSSVYDDPRFKKLTDMLYMTGFHQEGSGDREVKALADYVDARNCKTIKDAERWRFRQKFLLDGGAVLWSQRGCQYRNAQGAIICQGGTEEEAIDAAIQAQKDGHG